MSRLFITGSESFIGREFVLRAIERGHLVATLDRAPAVRSAHVVGDIRDRDLAAKIPAETDCIVHLAAVSRDADCRANPREAFDVNVMGTLNVIDAAVTRGVRQIVFASSEWVYGNVDNNGLQVEGQSIDATRMVGEYALTKIIGERLIAMAVDRGLVGGTVLRFGIVYGPRYDNWSAVESIFQKTATDDVITVGSGATARRFIHVSDIARGVIASIGRTGFETFNLSGDTLVTLRDVFDMGCEVNGRQPGFAEGSPQQSSIRNPDNRRAVATLGWKPELDLRAGLHTLVGQLVPPQAVGAR